MKTLLVAVLVLVACVGCGQAGRQGAPLTGTTGDPGAVGISAELHSEELSLVDQPLVDGILSGGFTLDLQFVAPGGTARAVTLESFSIVYGPTEEAMMTPPSDFASGASVTVQPNGVTTQQFAIHTMMLPHHMATTMCSFPGVLFQVTVDDPEGNGQTKVPAGTFVPSGC